MQHEDELAQPFLDGLRGGRLSLPHCRDCGRFHWQPMSRCPHCRSTAVAWVDVDPVGVVFTHSTVRHRFGKGNRTVPYSVALIELPAALGVRLIAEIEGVDTVSIGTSVMPVFRADETHPRLLYKALEVSPAIGHVPEGLRA
jgi:uncharacterized OB-fold protein